MDGIQVHLKSEAEEPLISASLHQLRCYPQSGDHVAEIESISVVTPNTKCLELQNLRFQLLLHSSEVPEIDAFSSILHACSYAPNPHYLPLFSHQNPYSSYHHVKSPLITLTSSLPSISLTVSKELLSSCVLFYRSLTPFAPTSSYSFFSPMKYDYPLFGATLRCASLCVQISTDSFITTDTPSVFTELRITEPSVSCTMGSQHFDLTSSVSSLHLSSLFCHLSSPLLLECLTGFHDGTDTDAWLQAQERYRQLPSRMTEILSISTPSSLALHSSPHMLPSLHHYHLLQGESDRGLVCIEDCFIESEIELDCRLGEVDLQLDDVCVSDLVWGALVVIEAFCGGSEESTRSELIGEQNTRSELGGEESTGSELGGEESTGSESGEQNTHSDSQEADAWNDPAITGQCRIQLTSPLFTLTCIYNQQPFQAFQLPGVFFELGFVRAFHQSTLAPSLCYCGGDCKGIYWSDLTQHGDTSDVSIDFFPHHQILQSRANEQPFVVRFQLSWRRAGSDAYGSPSLPSSLHSPLRGTPRPERRALHPRPPADGGLQLLLRLLLPHHSTHPLPLPALQAITASHHSTAVFLSSSFRSLLSTLHSNACRVSVPRRHVALRRSHALQRAPLASAELATTEGSGRRHWQGDRVHPQGGGRVHSSRELHLQEQVVGRSHACYGR